MRSSPYPYTIRLLLITGLIYGLLAGFLSPKPARAGFGMWTLTLANAHVTFVTIDPENEQIVYAGGSSGLYKTTNRGASWSAINPTAFKRMVVDPHASGNLYGIAGNTILKSNNGGMVWTAVYTSTKQLNDLLIDPNNSNSIYASSGSVTDSSQPPARIIHSIDGGATWSIIAESTASNFSGSSAFGSLAMIGGAPGLLYSTLVVYHGGQIQKATVTETTPPNWVGLQAPVSAAPLNPNDLVAAGDVANHSIYSTWSGPMSSSELVRYDNDGVPIQLGKNLPFSASNSPYALVTAMTVNPQQPDWLYVALQSGPRFNVQPQPPVQYGVFATPDQGQTWTEMSKLNRLVTDLKLAVEDHTLYAATGDGIYQLMIQWPVASRFIDFYNSHQGLRLLGSAIGAETVIDNKYPAQYFEKGRIEDHQGESSDPNWRFMYGLLVDELQQAKVKLPVGGDTSTLTYADLNTLADPSKRIALACAGSCPDGTWVQDKSAGTVFVPFSADLKFAPGHLVLGGFWNYINRKDLFPGGWLHDVGLPITEPQVITVTKNFATGPVQRTILVQAFQRTILTYDPANPADWQIERANVGTDYRKAFPDRVGP